MHKEKTVKGFRFARFLFGKRIRGKFYLRRHSRSGKSNARCEKDMENDGVMDRLICGDVGFGKTKSVIRAAFKAATDGKQVAVLVPTTILAFQHYRSFKERLKDFL